MVTALASRMWLGFHSRRLRHTRMWVEFLLGSRPFSEGFPGIFRFHTSTKTDISNFQFDTETVEVRTTSSIHMTVFVNWPGKVWYTVEPSCETTTYKRPLYQNTKLFPVKSLESKPLVSDRGHFQRW